MKTKFCSTVENARVPDGRFASRPGERQGAFRLVSLFDPKGPREMLAIVSDGGNWEKDGLPLPVWEHVSVSLSNRCPTWLEMSWVKELFFEDDELVLQLHVPRADHINLHPFTLHLWRPVGFKIPLPPRECV